MDARIARQYAERWTAAQAEAAALGRSYIACTIGARATHAAIGTIIGNGVIHPRALCQPHSPRTYAGLYEAGRQGEFEANCQRCIAGLQKRDLA